MATISIGPVVLDVARLSVFVVFALLVLAARLAERRLGPGLGDWAWAVGLAALVGGRLVYVALHLSAFLAAPLSILYVWQGGFSAWGALAGGAAVTWWRLHQDRRRLRAGAGMLAGAAALLLVLHLLPFGPDRGDMQLPSVTLDRLEADGSLSTLDVDRFSGRPVLLNLWATWCPPCRREMPLLAEYAAQDTATVFLLVNQQESPGRVGGYLDERELTFRYLLMDPEGRLATRFSAAGLPTTLVFGPSGDLVAARTGEVSRAWLDDAIRAAQRR
jgi:thiol-disulfide isomerase/thioredoxin